MFNEEAVENAIIEQLQGSGYDYKYNYISSIDCYLSLFSHL